MTLLRYNNFMGLIPRLSPRLLPPNAGQVANNIKLWSGELRAYLEPLTVITPSKGANALAIHPYIDGGTIYWFNWLQDTDVARGALAADPQNRVYFTQGGTLWETKTSGIATDLEGAAYGDDGAGGNHWVVVGAGGKILTSPDRITWTAQTSGTSEDLHGILYDGAGYVAVGDINSVLTSADGITWAIKDGQFTADNIHAVAYNGSNLYVIVGAAGKVSSSADGATWTARTGAHGASIIYGVAHGKDAAGTALWVAVGAGGKTSKSSDAITWAAQTTPATADFRSVASNGQTLFVAVGASGKIASSPDGATWEIRPSDTTATLRTVWHNTLSLWQIGGTGGTNLVSAYGLVWKIKRTETGDDIYGAAHDGGETWVLVGENGLILTGTDNAPRKTGNDIAIPSPGGELPFASYNMGVPAPTLKPTVSSDGVGTGAVVARAYVYTLVTGWGEEGPPSEPSAIIDWQDGDTITVSNMNGVALADDNILFKRIYRLNTGSAGAAYQFVVEISLATTSYADSIADADLGDVLVTTDFDPPPPDLAGIVDMPNGIMAGYSGREICFSEPFLPYAWPIKYRQAINYNAAGMGVSGLILVVATEGEPYIISGTHPENMSQRRLQVQQACVSKRGFEETAAGVVYPSPDGLYNISEQGSGIITEALFTRDEWQALKPESMHAVVHDGRYICWFDPDGGGTYTGLIFDPREKNAFLIYIDKSATAAVSDLINDALYAVIDGVIKKWDGATTNILTYTWKSKKEVLSKPINMGALQIHGDFSSLPSGPVSDAYAAARDAIIAVNAALWADTTFDEGSIGGDYIGAHPIGGNSYQDVPAALDTGLTVRVYGDGNIRAVKLVDKETPYRLPGGFRAKAWEVEVEGRVPVEAIYLASSISELRRA